MRNETIQMLLSSNIGSLIKEDILNNNLIKQNGSNEYYTCIKKILLSSKNTFAKEKELIAYLKNN